MGVIIGIIIAIIVIGLLKDLIVNLLEFLLKAAGVIILIGLVVGLIVLIVKNVSVVLSILAKVAIVAAIILAIAAVVFAVKKIILSTGDKNISKIFASISKEAKQLSPIVSYSSLIDKYIDKYNGVYIGDNDLRSTIKLALEDFCSSNICYVREGIGQIISHLGMNEYSFVYNQCYQEYGQYCIGDEDINQLISTEIEMLGELIYLEENDKTLVKAPCCSSGATYKQNYFEID